MDTVSSPNLRIALIQSDIVWENPAANYENYKRLLDKLDGPIDLLVLPEMLNTGFSMKPANIAEPALGPSYEWMRTLAMTRGQSICGSVAVSDGQHYYNRLYWISPDGNHVQYDKRHLFRMAGEHKSYSAGQERIVVELKGWKICPLICYDLRFPVWSRNQQDYDCLIYVANWPKVREAVWTKLLQARAIENLSYVAAVNRVGVDGNGIGYSGRSALIDYKGDIVHEIVDEQAAVVVELNRQGLEDFREKFPAHLDADQFSISK